MAKARALTQEDLVLKVIGSMRPRSEWYLPKFVTTHMIFMDILKHALKEEDKLLINARYNLPEDGYRFRTVADVAKYFNTTRGEVMAREKAAIKALKESQDVFEEFTKHFGRTCDVCLLLEEKNKELEKLRRRCDHVLSPFVDLHNLAMG